MHCTVSYQYASSLFVTDERKMGAHLGLLVHILRTASTRLCENNDTNAQNQQVSVVVILTGETATHREK